MKDYLRHWLTESDNTTHDLYRVLSLVAILTGLGLSVYTVVVKNQPFDIQTFGIGVGTLFAGCGAALALKPETKAGA